MTLRVKPGNGPSGGPGGMRTSFLGGGCTTTLPLRGRQTSGLWSQDQAMLERYFRLWQEQKTYGRALTIESSPLVSVAANWDAPAATAPSIAQPEPVGTPGPDLADLPDLILRLMSALSLNKSQAARVFKVTRPTLYEWLEGKAPNATNGTRIETLARWVERAGVSAARPLPLRFVRQPVVEGKSALVDALEADPLDEGLVNELLRVARALTDQAEARSAEREARLREHGFDEPDEDARKEQLAQNIAMRDWPER